MSDFDKQLYEDIGYIKKAVEKIDCMDKKMDALDKRMDKVENKINWVYGWAAGVAGVISIIFYFVKEKIWKS